MKLTLFLLHVYMLFVSGQGSKGTQQLTQKGASHPDEFGQVSKENRGFSMMKIFGFLNKKEKVIDRRNNSRQSLSEDIGLSDFRMTHKENWMLFTVE